MAIFKTAARSLLSTPGVSLVVIVTLAIAIGANTAIFSVVEGVLLRSLGYGDDHRLVVVWASTDSGGQDLFRLSPADYRDLRDGAGAFDGQVALYRSIGSTLTALDQPVRVGSLTVTPRLFRVLDAMPAAGQFFSDEDEKPGGGKQVVITHASWTRRFGADPAIVGSAIQLDSQPYTVVGVTQAGFQFPPGADEVEMYFPMRISDAVLLDRDHRMFDSIARLADGVTLQAAQAELETIAARLSLEFPDSNAGWSLVAKPLREELFGELSTTLWVLSAAVLLVLVTACVSVANLLVARSSAASRELAVRTALGARSRDLCARSLAESLILGAFGAAGGLALAYSGVALLRAFMPTDVPRVDEIGISGSVMMFAAGLSLGSTLLFGSLPALRSMTPDVTHLLKPAGGLGGAPKLGHRLRELMVVIEVALAIVLLVAAGLMVRSFAKLSEVDPGFHKEGVVSMAVQLTRSRYARAEFRPFFEQLVERVGQLPGILGVGAVSDLPMSNVGLQFEMEFTVAGLEAKSPTANPNAEFRLVVPGYFDAIGRKVVAGRVFDALDATGDRVVAMVNETVVERYFGDLDPIGRKLQVGMLGGELDIIGVASDIRHDGLQSKYESEIFLPYGKIVTTEMHVVVRSDLDTAEVSSAMGSVLAEMDPQIAPSELVALSDLLWESVARPRFNTALLVALALCAAILAAVGTYGIVAFTVARRTSEIGVRMALGADSLATVASVMRQALGIVLVGGLLGTLGALGATQYLRQLLFEVPPTDPVTYIVVLLGVVLVGVTAAWTPARRATRIDPVAALREE